MRYLIIVLSFFLITCGGGGGGSSPTEPTGPTYVVNLTLLSGNAQKGPFNNGTAITIAELTTTLSPTGRNFLTQITNNSGQFSVANVQLTSPYVELRANGYYFNEVANEVSTGQLTLYALSNLSDKNSINVNILTHLEKNRMASIMANPDNPKIFAQAKIQAQEDVLAIFDYSRENMPESELLNITQAGVGNAKLLAISAIVQGDLSVGQMSELLANISTDITSDGTLDDASLRNTLITNAANLDFAAIRNNLVVRYASLGMNVNIPDFETEINQFLKPPVVQDMSLSTDEDTAINITLAGSDPEGESITYSLVDDSNNATITLNGNVANYVPNTHFNGTDNFTYKANDGTSDSNIGTVTITVNAIDDDPNTNDVSVTTDEDTAVDISLTADEYDGQNYSFGIIANPSNGTVSLSGTTATYTPNQDWNGTDTFTFEATDDRIMFGKHNVATATITVNPINDAPIANDITSQVTDENRMMQLDITLDGTDIDGDALTYNITSTNNGSVSVNDNIATYIPTQDWNGEDTFTYNVNDGTVDSNTATVTITVNAIDDPPLITWPNGSPEVIQLSRDEDTMAFNQNHSLNFKMTWGPTNGGGSFINGLYNAYGEEDEDIYIIVKDIVENGTMYFWVHDSNPHQSNVVALSDTIKVINEAETGASGYGHFYYIANEHYNGVETFSVSTWDGTNEGEQIEFNLTINPVNDAPTLIDFSDVNGTQTRILTLDEDTPAEFLLATDIDGDVLSMTINNGTTDGCDGATGGVYSTSGATISISPGPNCSDANGMQKAVSITISDGQSWLNLRLNVYVTPIDDLPTAIDFTASTAENNSVDIPLQYEDVEGDTWPNPTYELSSSPANGTVTLNTEKTIATYTPNTGFFGTDAFNYSTEAESSVEGTVTITVNEVVGTVKTYPDVVAGYDESFSDILFDESTNGYIVTGMHREPGDDGGTTYGLISLATDSNLSSTNHQIVSNFDLNGAAWPYPKTDRKWGYDISKNSNNGEYVIFRSNGSDRIALMSSNSGLMQLAISMQGDWPDNSNNPDNPGTILQTSNGYVLHAETKGRDAPSGCSFGSETFPSIVKMDLQGNFQYHLAVDFEDDDSKYYRVERTGAVVEAETDVYYMVAQVLRCGFSDRELVLIKVTDTGSSFTLDNIFEMPYINNDSWISQLNHQGWANFVVHESSNSLFKFSLLIGGGSSEATIASYEIQNPNLSSSAVNNLSTFSFNTNGQTNIGMAGEGSNLYIAFNGGSDSNQRTDIIVGKFDSSLNLIWSKDADILGSGSIDIFGGITLNDDGVAVTGYTKAYNVGNTPGDRNGFILLLDSNGE